MQSIVHVAELHNGQVNFKVPPGKDLVWLLGWMDMAKEALKNQIVAQAQRQIEVPPPEAVGQLLNGVQ